MKIKFEMDESLCSACGACAIACMDQNDIDIENGQAPFRKIYQYENFSQTDNTTSCELISTSRSCMHCENAPCVDACPAGVLYKDEETGLTLYDNTSCISCHACEKSCPHDAISFNHEGLMEKCDGCIERIKAGLDPACAHTCPTGALGWQMLR